MFYGNCRRYFVPSPNWYRQAVGIDFGERWHTGFAYRRETLIAMGREVRRRFGSLMVGGVVDSDEPADLLTGAFGSCVVAAVYGVPILYAPNNWPASERHYLIADRVDRLEPPNLDSNPFF